MPTGQRQLERCRYRLLCRLSPSGSTMILRKPRRLIRIGTVTVRLPSLAATTSWLTNPIDAHFTHATASSKVSSAGSGCSSSASASIPFGRSRTSRSLGETITFSISRRTMRCCSAGKNCSQIASSRVVATATFASFSDGASQAGAR
jgi:hypothetical protein